MTESLFISDLHLSREQPATVKLFLGFLQNRAPQADALYILGDFFDTWVGDDDTSPPIPEVITSLRRLTDSGTPVFLQHGNRDFLLGDGFMAATGCTLLPDLSVVELGGIPTLLMHGDLLCTDDLDYQRARAWLRSDAFLDDFLSHSVAERIAIAANYRQQSGEATSLKAEGIMYVNQASVEKYMAEQGAQRLIHGHTHRPGIHDFQLNGTAVQRIVLSEWHEQHGALLSICGTGIKTEAVLAQD
ncbi:UDP-2,3-diacylglucosamine diphosphatase [Pseudomonadota bacterium]